MTPNWVDFAIIGGKAVFIWGFALTLLPVLIWFERKGAAFIQDRAGPNRAAVLGIRLAGFIHNIADVVKLLMKEMMIPPQVNRTYFMIAPVLGFTFILTSFAVIPWADRFLVAGRDISMQVADLNSGILYILAITSLNVYGIVLAGWSSNNKFALMGGLRSTAQMISYEIPLGLALVGIFMVFQSAQLNEIVRGQGDLLFGFLPKWGIVVQPLGAILFIVAAFAETNRNPFDLPEGESEIVAGYHVEYSGMRFALFYMGEYAAIVLSAAMITTLFFGGWQIPYVDLMALPALPRVLLGVASFFGKVIVLCWLQLLVRWTLPRFRYDQLMDLGWKRLMPLAIANLPLTAAWIWLLGGMKS